MRQGVEEIRYRSRIVTQIRIHLYNRFRTIGKRCRKSFDVRRAQPLLPCAVEYAHVSRMCDSKFVRECAGAVWRIVVHDQDVRMVESWMMHQR
jgi:hypothetical protein